MEITWPAAALLALLVLLNIVSFLTYLVQKEMTKSPSPSMVIKNSVPTPAEMRRALITEPRVIVLDRGKRVVYNGLDYWRVRWDEVVAKQVGNSLFVIDPDGSEQEYVRPCGSFVLGGVGYSTIQNSTFCVLPDGHCGKNHIDMRGNKKKQTGGE